MSSTETYFRTATVGGFHKQDVMDYITSANKEYQEKTAELTRQTEQAQREHAEMAEQLAAAEAERDEAVAECRQLTAELARCVTTLDTTKRELADLRKKQEETAAQLAELNARLPGLEQDAKAYAQVKDRVTAIEAETRRRAQEEAERTEVQTARLRSELEGWLERVQSTYQSLRTKVSATVTQLTDELDRSRTVLNEADDSFRAHDEALNALLQSESRPVSVAFPDPLPLEEDVGENNV